MGKYNLIRVDPPIWENGDRDLAESLILGEQREWVFNVPAMYQSLAAPEILHRFVRRPEPQPNPYDTDHREHITARGYWFSLLHMLYFNFGWLQPAAGLEWWLQNGQPTEDHRFALIAETWMRDGYLDQIVSWSNRSGVCHAIHPFAKDSFLMSLRQVPHDISRNLELELEQMKIANPLTGGGDPLHLGPHLDNTATSYTPLDSQLITSSSSEPRAVLLLDYMRGFYERLAKIGADLGEHPSGRSWRIEVVVKQVGHLGTYRRSRETGLWFAGPHSLHMVGNPKQERS